MTHRAWLFGVFAVACTIPNHPSDAIRSPVPCGYPTGDTVVERAAARSISCAHVDVDETLLATVHARVGSGDGERDAELVIDTGDVDLWLTRPTARTVGVPIHQAFGDSLGMVDVGFVLDGVWRLPQPEALVADFPQLDQHHLDGLLPPQLLATADLPVVFDPVGRRMFTVDRVTAATLDGSDSDGGPISAEAIAACNLTTTSAATRDLPEQRSGTRYFARGTVDGADASFLIDTASSMLTMDSRRAARGMVSAEVEVGRASFKGTFPTKVFAHDAQCPFHGSLGMDLLLQSRCALVLYPDHAVARCQPGELVRDYGAAVPQGS